MYHVSEGALFSPVSVSFVVFGASGHTIKPRATRFVSGKANRCRWRPRRYHVDLLWDETLPTASYAVLLNRTIFFGLQRSDFFNASFPHTRRQMIRYRTPPGARHVSNAVIRTMCPEGGSEPLTSAPSSESMTQSFDSSIDDNRGLSFSLIRTFDWFFSGRFSTKICSAVSSFRLFFERFAPLPVKWERKFSWRATIKSKLFRATMPFHYPRYHNVASLSYRYQPKERHCTLLCAWLLCVQCRVASATALLIAWPVLLRCMKKRMAKFLSLTAAHAVWEGMVQKQEGQHE